MMEFIEVYSIKTKSGFMLHKIPAAFVEPPWISP
jgi:hypothetical protein